MKISSVLFLLCALFAAFSPVIFDRSGFEQSGANTFPGWPEQYQGKSLTQLPLTEKEAGFVKGFPGKIARFTDGDREMIIRWVELPTRKLHPAASCFKGSGYSIKPRPIEVNHSGINMGCFDASKGDETLKVCEYIEAADGQNWSDISSWYWGAVTGDGSSGWMSFVIADRVR